MAAAAFSLRCPTCSSVFSAEVDRLHHMLNEHLCIGARALEPTNDEPARPLPVPASTFDPKPFKPEWPPYDDMEGEWVLTEDFAGNKSFGLFRCAPCESSWMSAHATMKPDAQTAYKQACKYCDTWTAPLYMWQNADSDSRWRSQDEDDKPHMSHLCEACKLGECTY